MSINAGDEKMKAAPTENATKAKEKANQAGDEEVKAAHTSKKRKVAQAKVKATSTAKSTTKNVQPATRVENTEEKANQAGDEEVKAAHTGKKKKTAKAKATAKSTAKNTAKPRARENCDHVQPATRVQNNETVEENKSKSR